MSQQLQSRFEASNGSKAESGANTLTYVQVEVPNSKGAKAVILTYAELDVGMPDIVATRSTTSAIMQVGKKVPTAVNISQTDAVMSAVAVEEGGAGPVSKGLTLLGPDVLHRRVPVRAEQDGSYYVTFAVLGNANTAASIVLYRAEYDVYW